jgi:hypothetical protein
VRATAAGGGLISLEKRYRQRLAEGGVIVEEERPEAFTDLESASDKAADERAKRSFFAMFGKGRYISKG